MTSCLKGFFNKLKPTPPKGFALGGCCSPQILAEFGGIWYTIHAALLQTGNRKEVSTLEHLIGFLLAVAANVVSDYIRKWLDRAGKGK